MCVCTELTAVGEEGSSGPSRGWEGWQPLQAKLGCEQLNRKSAQSCTLHVCVCVHAYI